MAFRGTLLAVMIGINTLMAVIIVGDQTQTGQLKLRCILLLDTTKYLNKYKTSNRQGHQYNGSLAIGCMNMMLHPSSTLFQTEALIPVIFAEI